MQVTRRGLFASLGGMLAAALCPKPPATEWKSWYACVPFTPPERVYFSEISAIDDWEYHEFGLSFEVTETAESEAIHDSASWDTEVGHRLRAAAERLRRA